ncbi:MAG: fumarylacetoacetate hydrolase family protein [Candidatus Promineifilaceae bacterium]
MKLITFFYQGQNRIGAVVDKGVVDLSSLAPDLPALIELGSEGLKSARAVVEASASPVALGDVTLLAPIPVPRRNVMCLGLNYAEHAQESYAAGGREMELPQVPIVFTKATTAVTGPFAEIPYDPAVSAQMDWEVELAVVIGKGGKNIPESQAMDHVFGYTVVNDVSARDLQQQGKQFFKGKSLDGACPMGPWIVTADELPDPHNLRLTCRVNGSTKQDSNTTHMIFKVPAIIAYLSRGMSLLPGDIIATGTPSGVGFARQPPEFLKAGDVVECEVKGVGLIRNMVKA